ncbi:MAG: TIGR00730 family Rossman fold protein [Proteobacteria bacterium]|nr:MAG: TIGR00730 family Rossman fold protein [Pseudomonadota bacterium]
MKIAIYCGSNKGNNKIYEKEAKKLGKYFAKHDIGLVYGGGNIGIMGVIADSVMKNGGHVCGVITEFLKDKEAAHKGISELIVTKNMHKRKKLMIDLADAFVALPGGAGTMDEIFEAWTWLQIGLYKKPCGFYNINGFYDKLMEFLLHMNKEGFLNTSFIDALVLENKPKNLIKALRNAKKPLSKWGE